MTTEYMGLITPGSDYMTVFNKVYPVLNDQVTIPSNVGDTATIIIKSSYVDGGYFYNSAQNATCKSIVYLCDSNGNNAVAILTKEMAAKASDPDSVYTSVVNISPLKGKRIYAKVVPVTSSGNAGVIINARYDSSGMQIAIAFNAVTGNKILATDRSQFGVSTTQGSVMKDSNFSSGTIITAAAFNSKYIK